MHFFARPALLLIFAAALCTAACHNETSGSFTKVAGIEVPNLLPRDTVKASAAEQSSISSDFEKAISTLRANSDNPKPLLDLATTYLLESRISGNKQYYNNAALQMLNHVLDGETATQDQRFQALSLKAGALLNLNQFRAALQTAHEGLAISQFNAGLWGCVADAQVELGHYDSALKACDKMIHLRPDLRSYARVSYLREIYGDYAGAIGAMRMAVQSGVAGLEATEWARVELGNLYFKTGKLDSAQLLYKKALGYLPGYAPADVGLAQACAAQNRIDSAIHLAMEAVKSVPEPDNVAVLADLYERKGDAAKAAQARADVIRMVAENGRADDRRGAQQFNNSRELALAYEAAKDYKKAIGYAHADYARRPDNIDACELMAWLSFKTGDLNAARSYAEKALATGSRNAVLRYKCGIIFSAAGDKGRGTALQQQALSTMPYLDPLLRQ